jgi:hypothetical protein
MMKVALFADVTGLATAVAGLHERFEGLSTINVHGDARREYMQRGVHCCRGRACEWRNENGMCGGAGYVVGMGAK